MHAEVGKKILANVPRMQQDFLACQQDYWTNKTPLKVPATDESFVATDEGSTATNGAPSSDTDESSAATDEGSDGNSAAE